LVNRRGLRARVVHRSWSVAPSRTGVPGIPLGWLPIGCRGITERRRAGRRPRFRSSRIGLRRILSGERRVVLMPYHACRWSARVVVCVADLAAVLSRSEMVLLLSLRGLSPRRL
jgi:hypothetical protein